MNLDRSMVYGDAESLRRAIASHTDSDATAAGLVAEILVARGLGRIEHVTLLPPSVPEAGQGWKLRIRHNPLS